MRGSSCPSPSLRCLPLGAHLTALLPAPAPTALSGASCITFCVGGTERASILGRQTACSQHCWCKNNPQVALLWPQTLYQQRVFPWYPPHPPSLQELGAPSVKRPHMV